MAVLKPEISHDIEFLKLYREQFTDVITVVYPNNDSFLLSLEEVKLLLHGFQVHPRIVEKMLDTLWNTYAVQLDLKRDQFISIERLKEVNLRDNPLVEAYGWIL